MKRFMMTALASSLAIAVATPASAAVLLPGATGVTFDAFSGPRGTLLGTLVTPAVGATTFTGTMRSAVYQQANGELDFYFQVAVDSINPNDEVNNISAFNFAGYTVNALVDTSAFGIFAAANNPQTTPGEMGGFTSTASRNGGTGGTVRADFGMNGLEAAGQTSATYIFRTNATNFNQLGNFTAQDGSVAQRPNFQPIAAVPEPATWGMMIAGFGLMGGVLRRRKATVAFA